MKFCFYITIILLISKSFPLKYPSNFLQIAGGDADLEFDMKKKDLDDDPSIDTDSDSDILSNNKKNKSHNDFDDLKDFNLNDISLKDPPSNHKNTKSLSFDDSEEDSLDKKLEALDKASSGSFAALAKTKYDPDEEDDDIKKSLVDTSNSHKFQTKRKGGLEDMFSDSKTFASDDQPSKHRFIEDDEKPKTKKFSDEDEDDHTSHKREEHHSQAYLRHMEQMKKQKDAENESPPAKKDPILGSFVKSLESIASGDNSTSTQISTIHLPPFSPFNSMRETLSENYVNADKSLIKNLLNKNVFNNLPAEVKNLIKHFQNQYKINETLADIDPTKFFDSNNASLTPSSQPFVDSLGKIGRRGFLTLINTTSLTSESVWTILNGRVFCIYNSEDYVSIYRLFRNSALKFRDMIGVPCFTLFIEQENQKEMLCASSIHEKEIWFQAFIAVNPRSPSFE